MERLCWRLGTEDLEEVRRNLEAALAEAIARGEVKREPCWTEGLAVGSAQYIEQIKPMLLSRRETEVMAGAEGLLVLREPAGPYGQETDFKSGGNDQN